MKRICDICGRDADTHYMTKGLREEMKIEVQVAGEKKDLCGYCLIDGLRYLDDRPRACNCDCHR